MQPEDDNPTGSIVCRCGKHKGRREPWCWVCFFSLSPELRTEIQEKGGEEFDRAYVAACKYLDTHQR
jgi:hypothetical protein